MLRDFGESHADYSQVETVEKCNEKTDETDLTLIERKVALIKYFADGYYFTLRHHLLPFHNPFAVQDLFPIRTFTTRCADLIIRSFNAIT